MRRLSLDIVMTEKSSMTSTMADPTPLPSLTNVWFLAGFGLILGVFQCCAFKMGSRRGNEADGWSSSEISASRRRLRADLNSETSSHDLPARFQPRVLPYICEARQRSDS